MNARPTQSGRAQPQDQLPAGGGQCSQRQGLLVVGFRDVIVVGVEAAPGNLQPRGEGVQLGVALVADQV